MGLLYIQMAFILAVGNLFLILTGELGWIIHFLIILEIFTGYDQM